MDKSEMRPCKKCDKVAVRVWTGSLLLTVPAQYNMVWYCDCGWREPAGYKPIDVEAVKAEHGKAWKAAQKLPKDEKPKRKREAGKHVETSKPEVKEPKQDKPLKQAGKHE
jgi:hypothetical protein